MWKRAFDVVGSLAGLVLLSPLLLFVAACVKLSSRGPVLFTQERIGRGLRPFFIYKFRSMVADAPCQGAWITVGEDPRITRVGAILRKLKIDELPQLINVLKGEMSFVGPRPEVRKYVNLFCRDFEEILQVRPGITDLASICYCDEAAILGRAEDPEAEYARRVLPRKIRLARAYLRKGSLWFDLVLIARTLLVLIAKRRIHGCRKHVPCVHH